MQFYVYLFGCLNAEENWHSWATPFIIWKNAKLFPQRTEGMGLPCRKPLLLLNCLLEEESRVKFKVNGNKMEVGSLKIKNLVVGKRENKI